MRRLASIPGRLKNEPGPALRPSLEVNLVSAPRGLAAGLLMAAACLLLSACEQIPTSGPSTQATLDAPRSPGAAAVQVIDIDAQVVRELAQGRRQRMFSELPLPKAAEEFIIGSGDGVEISIWEAPPAMLFGGGGAVEAAAANAGAAATSRATVLPEQLVDSQGFITVPFAGRVQAAGRPARVIQADIVARLRGKAHDPEVVLRVVRNASSVVTVIGEVTTSLRLPLTPSGERVLDALAAAGGTRQPVNKMMLQLTRGGQHLSLPLDRVIRDPQQNVRLAAGDVVTAISQPSSFTALGATGRNEEIPFEAQGITLAQGLARAGGLLDNRSDAQGVFIFRYEPRTALTWSRPPEFVTAEGMVPVLYRLDLRNPASFFVMQGFAVQDKDVLYVSNAPLSEVQKFLNLVFSLTFPVINVVR